MRRSSPLAGAILTGLLLAGVVSPAAARTAEGAGATASAREAAGEAAPARVRLVTGDTVEVTDAGGGRRTAQVLPGPGREDVTFQVWEQDGELTVLPADAWPLIATGTLDARLFDVSGLLAQGYDEAHADALPLIVSAPQGDGHRRAASAARELTALHDGSAPSLELESIDARSVRIAADDLGEFWATLAAPAEESAALAAAEAAPHVWLDARVAAELDRSTAQINAPQAWQAGFTGSGVTVAVLDTGADADHPDLAGRISAARDFSGSGSTGDAFGHGTHVAATVGGSGAGSDGARRGVAPDADLLIGKVLGDDGYGTDSMVIAGMEWAAAEGADVVNMSLGDDTATDGTDPLSLALNELTESSGALFVVAAGNNGEAGPGTVGSPGAADAALTVGAVDREDGLAPFSSRGPREGDGAVKPDLTAPGVGIVAARASGTTLGDPVDEQYTSLSGTSMATPHVAGAAALLAQAHPDWDAGALKDALISTAEPAPGTLVTEQGGGRVDAGAAVTGPLTATGTLAFGPFEAGGDTAGESATLRWTNGSSAPLTLRLTAHLETAGGRELPEGALALSADSVEVPAGGTAEVELTADPAGVGRGDYYGYVTAATPDGGTVVHTTVGLVVNGPVHRITPTVLDEEGEPIPGALPLIWGPDGFAGYDVRDGRRGADVEEGTYVLADFTESLDADGLPQYRMVYLPEVAVTEDTDITLDMRETRPVTINTPEPAEQRTYLTFQTHRELDGHSWSNFVQYPIGESRLMVNSAPHVAEGSFEFAVHWQLTAPLLTARVRGGADLDAFYLPSSPLFDRQGSALRAVDAGSADAPDFGGARGALAIVRGDPGGYAEFTAAAAEAGVAAVALVADEGHTPWSRWNPSGTRWSVPLVRIGAAQGAALLSRAERRRTEVVFSGTAQSPYLYDVMQVETDALPARIEDTVSARNTARIRTTYADTGSAWGTAHRLAWRPYQSTAVVDPPRYVPMGTTRTEYLTAGDTVWQHYVHYTVPYLVGFPVTGTAMRNAPRAYHQGERLAEEWFGAVTRPAVPVGTATPTVRVGDTMRLRIPAFADSGDGHWSPGTATATLYRNGTEAGRASGSSADVEVAPGRADYRLDLDTERAEEDWRFGTATRTSWWFSSDTAAQETPLPLLQLDYETGTDAANTVHEGRRHTLGLSVRHQEGLPAPHGVSVRVEVSYDDGETFADAVRVRERGRNAFAAELARPAGLRGDAWVTLRVTASDDRGNRVRQTVERAYLDRG
ncbi:S8 family serine peptidase [Streptomyces hoynatensis]|uniref:Peptidase S8 n=1 Tax=Streptomyces hoynatensis TaxID=1141874 RepID=A0A3A9ZBR5_9ACTN|nr:S8 family serine peptidase [Streptomyces hoynatensis]RKN45730.1 peptidase S8 [Streptomyces hoynatensis]